MSGFDLLLFSVPGLMAYFWIEKIGVTPPVKPTVPEQTALGAILWLPTLLITMYVLGWLGIDLPSIKNASFEKEQIYSFFWFLSVSVLSSFIVSVGWAYALYPVFNALVNLIRIPLKRGKLNRLTTVWEKVFTQGDKMVVRISKLGSNDSPIIGEVSDSSRPLSGERSLVLKHQYFWSKVYERGEVRVDHSFINTDSGLIVEVLAADDLYKIVLEHQDLKEILLMPSTPRRKR